METQEGINWVTSIANQHCQRIRLLASSKGRKTDRAFLVEGERLLSEAIEQGWQPELVAFSKTCFEKKAGESHFRKMLDKTENVIVLPDELMDKISATETSAGCIAVFAIPDGPVLATFIDAYTCFLVLDRISDPGNMGALLRSANAFNCGLVITEGCVDVWSPKVVRASMGAIFYPGFIRISSLEWTNSCAAHNIVIAVAATQGEEINHRIFGNDKCAVVIGNEAHGVSAFWLDRADRRLTIPMRGSMESLNAAIAGSIIAYEFSK